MASVQLIADNSLRVTPEGYEVQVRLRWYRSLPLSCVETVRLALDGEWVDPTQIAFGINEQNYQLDELDDLVEEFWFVQDSAFLRVNQPGKISSGEEHTIEVEINCRAPYIKIGPGKYLTIVNDYSSTQVAG